MRDRNIANPYLTPVNIVLVLVNIVVFLVLDFTGDTQSGAFMYEHGAMFPAAVLADGQWYRLFSSAFIHFGISHLVNNMIMLVCLGSYLERAIGAVKYAVFYAAAAAGSSLISMAHMLHSGDFAVSGGASGVVFGIIGALLYLVIRNKGRFEDLTMTRFLIMVALSLYYGFSTAGVDNAAHLGGLLVGFVMGILLYRKAKHEQRYRGGAYR